MKYRDTVEAIVGAVTGSLRQPEVLVVGRYRGTELELVGRTVKMKEDQAAEIGKFLKPAGPRHPWPDEISTHWGKGSKTPSSKSSRGWSSKSPPMRLLSKPATIVTRCASSAADPTLRRTTATHFPPAVDHRGALGVPQGAGGR